VNSRREPEADLGPRLAIAANVLGRAGRHDPTGGDDRHAIGQRLGLIHVVGGEEDGLAQVAQAADHVPGLPPGRGVEAGGRLIQEEQLGIADQGQGHVEAPLLPTRERRGAGVGLLAQPDQVHRLVDVPGGGVVAGVLLHRLARRQLGDQTGLLEDEAHAVPPCPVRPLRVDAEHAHLPRVARPVALEDLDGGGLAGAIRAQEGEDLARADLEIDPPHRLQAVVGLAQALDADHGFGHGAILGTASPSDRGHKRPPHTTARGFAPRS
jgi:hypothetical protein